MVRSIEIDIMSHDFVPLQDFFEDEDILTHTTRDPPTKLQSRYQTGYSACRCR